VGNSIYFLTATWLAAQGLEPQPMMSGVSGMSGMNGQCTSCQNGGMHGGMGSGRRYFGGNGQQGSAGIFQRMGNRVRGFWDRCLGEDDGSYMHNMNQMQHMNQMNHTSGASQMGQMRRGPGNMHEMNSMPTSVKVTEPPLADVAPNQSSHKSPPRPLSPITFRPHGGSNTGNSNSNNAANSPVPANRSGNSGGVVGKTPLSARMAEKVGHESDFSWITGQIRRESSGWVIYFATPETIDRYNGRLPIASGVDMSKFQDGNLVTAHGQVNVRGNQASYQAASVDLIEHDAK